MAINSNQDPLYRPLEVDQREIRILEIRRCPVLDLPRASGPRHLPREVLSQLRQKAGLLGRFKATSQDHGSSHNDAGYIKHPTSLHLALKQVPVAEAAPFKALSYVWGPPDAQHLVQIDGNTVTIRQNLAMFLQVLIDRYCPADGKAATESSVLRIWVDALCINQEDVTERNSQVTMMGDIFRSASDVLAWLGPSTRESELWFDCVEELALGTFGTLIPRRSEEEIALASNDVTRREYWHR